MKRFLFIFTCLLMSACSTIPSAIEDAPAVDITYQQASSAINSYKDAQIRWGGIIVDLKNEQDFSLLQVLSYPLNRYGRPMTDEPYHGRFLIKTADFLDPAVYVKDKEVTVAGMIKGASERRIGNKTLNLPMIESNVLYLWPDYDKNDYYGGYGPYYWGGYGYYPYYWGGFYRPYPRW